MGQSSPIGGVLGLNRPETLGEAVLDEDVGLSALPADIDDLAVEAEAATPLDGPVTDPLAEGIAEIFASLRDEATGSDPTFVLLGELNRLWAGSPA